MYKIYPYITNDLSVGLFSHNVDDIYHSVTGAATEAYTKFIFPAGIEDFLNTHNTVRVLDVCYGIGYNTKSFLNFIFQKKYKNFSKNFVSNDKLLSYYNDKIHANNIATNNATIYSDNISLYNYTNYNGSICTDNIMSKVVRDTFHGCLQENIFYKNFKIKIKAIEIERPLAFLSPFINSKISKTPKIQFENKKISKFSKSNINQNLNKNFVKIPDELVQYPPAINLLLFTHILKSHPDILYNKELINVLSNSNYTDYFSADIKRIFECYVLRNNKLALTETLSRFLHNIYYEYISVRYKKDLKAFNSLLIDFSLKINDARVELKPDESKYDFIFLDAFTPAKCPCLWTYDFLKLLYNRLSEDGIILTYSNSAAVRNAFTAAGLEIGKIFNPVENRFTGTMASKKISKIKYQLSEYEIGLLKTRAGIPYRDETLSASNSEILERRNSDFTQSNLISVTSYKKQFSNLTNCNDIQKLI